MSKRYGSAYLLYNVSELDRHAALSHALTRETTQGGKADVVKELRQAKMGLELENHQLHRRIEGVL